MTKPRIIAIDGPSGSGKGTVARRVASQLGLPYIDTGAMYRVVGLAAIRRGAAWDDDGALTVVAETVRIDLVPDGDGLRVLMDGEDVTQAIRAEDVGQAASKVSTVPGVRKALVRQQQALGHRSGAVMEGRDIGTVVFPDADLKVFLTAPLDVRARRRQDQLARAGEAVSFEQVRRDMERRDRRDSGRAADPLRPAEDAIEVDTTDMTIEEATERVLILAVGDAPGSV